MTALAQMRTAEWMAKRAKGKWVAAQKQADKARIAWQRARDQWLAIAQQQPLTSWQADVLEAGYQPDGVILCDAKTAAFKAALRLKELDFVSGIDGPVTWQGHKQRVIHVFTTPAGQRKLAAYKEGKGPDGQ